MEGDTSEPEYPDISGNVLTKIQLGEGSLEQNTKVVGLTNPKESRSRSADDIGRKIGNRIEKLRKEKGVNQGELAEEVNKSHSWVSKVERGNTRFTVDSLIALAKALDVSLTRLTSVDDKPHSLLESFVTDPDSGSVFLLRLGGAGTTVAVASDSSEIDDSRDRIRKYIAQYAGEFISSAVYKHFQLEHERIEDLVEEHDYLRESVRKGYKHIVDECKESGDTTLTVRVASLGEAGFDSDNTMIIDLEELNSAVC